MNASSLKKIFPLLAGILFLPVYFLTTNQLFSFDAITNAIACETNEPLRWFHANHLLYPFIGVAWYRLERLLGYDGFALYSLARLNSFLMAAALGVFAVAMGKFLKPARAFIVACFLGSTFAVWHYAVDGRAVGASVFFAALLIYGLAKSAPFSESRLSVLGALYPLLHAIGIFHLPATAWLLYKQRRAWLAYTILTIGILAVFYGGIYFSIQPAPTIQGYFFWPLGYAGFHGSDKALQSPYWAAGFTALLQGLWDGWRFAFVYHEKYSQFFGLTALAVALLSVVRIKHLKGFEKNFAIALMTWGGLATFFLAFWSPGQEGFRLHVIIPWISVAALCFKNSLWFWRLMALAAALQFGANLSGRIFYDSSIQNNVGYQLLSEIDKNIDPGDLVLTASTSKVPDIEVLLPYFYPEIEGGTLSGRLFAFKESSLDALNVRIAYKLSLGKKVFLADDFYDAASLAEIESRSGFPAEAVQEWLEQWKLEPAFAAGENLRFFRLIGIKSAHG